MNETVLVGCAIGAACVGAFLAGWFAARASSAAKAAAIILAVRKKEGEDIARGEATIAGLKAAAEERRKKAWKDRVKYL